MTVRITTLGLGVCSGTVRRLGEGGCSESGLNNVRACEELTARDARFGELSNRLGRTHRIEGARNELRRARAVPIVSLLGFEQFRVRQDDSELVVQPME
jgi:hypothetical protein